MHNPMESHFLRDESGAVAATYAMALTALIVIAGVGFDYGRLATMDSELQNGADQAALAGATQLDGKSGACARAAGAAVSLVTNATIVANDANTISVASETACDATGTVKFWQNKEGTTAANSDANARFIELTVAARTVDYAFTPIVNLMQGSVVAGAMAGLGSSICKVPPVFMCNPNEGGDPGFDITSYIGKGIRLIANDGGSNYTPGNFGYLESGAGNGAQAVAQTLGRQNIPGDCISIDLVTTKPGAQISVLDALNTRFDVYANGLTQVCGADNSLCPPSANSRKDLTHKGGANNCAFANGNGNGWHEAPNAYLPSSATFLYSDVAAENLSPMGYPRDICHAVAGGGGCAGGRVGTGTWDRNAYFLSNDANYAAGFDISAAFGTATPSRYQVYRYEAANPATRLQTDNLGGGENSRPQPYCRAPGVAVGTAAVDRRVLSVAIVNCAAEGVQGATSGVDVTKWVDVFLVEPSVRRRNGSTDITEQSDVYIEIIGATAAGGGG